MKTAVMAVLFLIIMYIATVGLIYWGGLWAVEVVKFFKLIFSETPTEAIRSAMYVSVPIFPLLVVWVTNKFSDKDLTK